MKLFFDRIVYYAQFYDDSGRPIGLIKIPSKTFQFKYKDKIGMFVFVPDCSSFIKFPIFQGPILTGFMKIFHYNFDNPEPLTLIRNYNPSFSSEEFNIMITSKKLSELNDLSKDENIFLKLLKNPIFWIILILIGGFYWYLSTHNWKLW